MRHALDLFTFQGRVGRRPTAYWKRWTELFLHAIHLRVLDHIKQISEQPTLAQRTPAVQPAWMAAANATCDCTRHAAMP